MNPEKQYTIVKQHFQKQFHDASKINIRQFIGNPKPLNNRITTEEIKNVLKSSNNNKTTGSDEIQMELIKYSTEYILIEICNNLNKILENHVNEINLGHSILLPNQKPNKEKGPPKNIRPLNLLNIIRKILSMITMKRIKSKVENYISHSQSAYRANRPRTDIIWAYRFISYSIVISEHRYTSNKTRYVISFRYDR